MGELDTEKRIEVITKMYHAQAGSIDLLTKRMQALSQDDSLALIDKAQKIVTQGAGRADALEQAFKKLAQNVSVAMDLAKSDVKLKIALARIEAVAAQVEQLAKDHVSRADLVALEKRMIDVIKKSK